MPRTILFAVCIGLLSSAAIADPGLVQSAPAKDAAVKAPKRITLTFGEKIAPDLSGFQLSMGDGMVAKTVTKVSADGKTMTATPTGPFMAGKWTVKWHAVSDDGHRSEGSFDFTVK